MNLPQPLRLLHAWCPRIRSRLTRGVVLGRGWPAVQTSRPRPALPIPEECEDVLHCLQARIRRKSADLVGVVDLVLILLDGLLLLAIVHLASELHCPGERFRNWLVLGMRGRQELMKPNPPAQVGNDWRHASAVCHQQLDLLCHAKVQELVAVVGSVALTVAEHTSTNTSGGDAALQGMAGAATLSTENLNHLRYLEDEALEASLSLACPASAGFAER